MKYSSSFINTFLLFSFLFLYRVTSTNNVIHNSCKKAAKGDPNLSYDFCVTLFEGNPKSQNASKLEELIVISIDMAISKATNISSYITQLLMDKKLDAHSKSCLQDCFELYSDAKSKLQDAINDFGKSRDFEKANIELSFAMDASTTCEDGFHEEKKGGHGEKKYDPLLMENNIFFQLTVIPLAFINLYHS